MNTRLEYIKTLDFFSSLDSVQLSSLQDFSQVHKYPKASVLYYENEKLEKLFFLVSGALKVYKIDKNENEIFLYNIYKNSLICELTNLKANTIETFSNVEFLEDSIVLEVNYKTFKEQFLAKNILNNELMDEILFQTQQLHHVVNRELVFDASAKVAFMLINDLSMFNSLKHQDVSFMLHIQPETLSRTLQKLKQAKIIDIQNNKIIITHKDALRSRYILKV